MRIGIIGGGASGMILGALLENKGNYEVTILERNSKLGKKLLLTGNGKCNFTNGDFSNLNEIYNSGFASELYKKYDENDFIKFLSYIGIEPKVEIHRKGIYYYPKSNKASSVYYNLLDKINNNRVNIVLDAFVKDIEVLDEVFAVKTTNNKYEFDKLIVATGGITHRNTGSDGNILNCMEKLGHHIIKPVPALSGLAYDDAALKNISGVRFDARVTAIVCGSGENKTSFVEAGEVQITGRGISGIPVMNLSRHINRSIDDGDIVNIYIDFYETGINKNNNDLSDGTTYDEEIKVFNLLKDRRANIYYKDTKNFLCGFLPDEIAEIVIDRCNIKSNFVKGISDDDLRNIAKNIVSFEIKNVSIANADEAQITMGGIQTDDLDIDTLESKIVKNLYFIGEVIDIDGRCGGYNLQLAYSSARTVASNFIE